MTPRLPPCAPSGDGRLPDGERPRNLHVACGGGPMALIASCLLVLAWLFAPQARAEAPSPAYVGSTVCESCHAKEVAAWKASHHAAAMSVATAGAVRGDFNGASAQSHGAHARFLREGDGFFVETEGRDGKTARFAISYTFGIEPLQQYLVRFDDGRIQALPWAWDTRAKEAGGQRWLHLYPDRPVPSADPLHWTRGMQNWNHMCAECHVTGLSKNYDAAKDRFDTRMTEIGVGCESCHGPASGHIDWTKTRDAQATHTGFASTHVKRAAVAWTPDPKTGSPTQTAPHAAGDEVELCAHCHSRRGQIAEHWRPGEALENTHAPALVAADLFEDDGQMKDEVFNDQSFKQSLMYARGVVCGDCHDPHSAKLKTARTEICSQCHLRERFASPAHTRHEVGHGAPDCVACHMPTRTYMVIDARHDHSFRIPRPDLSVAYGTPNACNDCHKDRPPVWAAEAIEKWHGATRKGFQTWAEALHRARRGEPAGRALLLELVSKPQTPAILRATAISEMQRFTARAVDEATRKALNDPDPVVRMAAARRLSLLPIEQRWRDAAPLLGDAARAVRIEAGNALADQPLDGLSPEEGSRLQAAWAEYELAQRLDADRPEARANLGTFYLRRGKPEEAETEYLAGLKLEPGAPPLAVNLSDLYRAQGKESAAEKVLRESIAIWPNAGATHHALGLSLIRQKRYEEAGAALARSVQLAPEEARFAYVEIVALRSLGRDDDARAALEKARRRFPFDPELLQLQLQDALQQNDPDSAGAVAQTLSELMPDDAEIARFAARLRSQK